MDREKRLVAARRRLAGIRASIPEDRILFCGLPLEEFTKEEVEVMLAYQKVRYDRLFRGMVDRPLV